MSPTKPEAYFYAGVTMAKARDETLALEYLDKAIKLDAKNAEAYLVRGAVKNILCDYTGAKKDLQTAAKLGVKIAGDFAEKIQM